MSFGGALNTIASDCQASLTQPPPLCAIKPPRFPKSLHKKTLFQPALRTFEWRTYFALTALSNQIHVFSAGTAALSVYLREPEESCFLSWYHTRPFQSYTFRQAASHSHDTSCLSFSDMIVRKIPQRPAQHYLHHVINITYPLCPWRLNLSFRALKLANLHFKRGGMLKSPCIGTHASP